MAITLTQDTYRLWARIGPSVSNTQGGVLVTDSTVNVLAQVAQLLATSVTNEQY
jgi:hypothetical protein